MVIRQVQAQARKSESMGSMASHRHGSGGDGHQDAYDVAQAGTEDPGLSWNMSLWQAAVEAPEEAGQGH